MASNQISTGKYLELFQSSNEDIIDLLSRDFEDQDRYKDTRNPIAKTWLISFENIIQLDQLASSRLPQVFMFLSSKGYPTLSSSISDESKGDGSDWDSEGICLPY